MAVVNTSSTDSAELCEFLKRYPDCRYVDALFIDLCGISRGKRYPRHEMEKLFAKGLQIPLSIYFLDVTGDCLDPLGLGVSNGDPDANAMPLPGTLAPIPWADDEGAQVLMSFRPEEEGDYPVDPRNVAAEVLAKLAARDLHPVVAFELEFYLLDPESDAEGRPQPPLSPLTGERDRATQVYSLDDLAGYGPFFSAAQRACQAQGLPASVSTAEFAPAQFEINLQHVPDPLRAADHCVLLRHTIKNVARQQGMRASFMPKPFAEQAGSGMHLHISLLDGNGKNLFADESSQGNALLHQAIAGTLATMGEAMAIFAPNLNGFRRYQPEIYVPVNRSWAANNRSVACRIPSGPPEARRLEHRVAGADANPYLVLAVILAGMLHGIEEGLDPGPASSGNAGESVDPTLPRTLASALDQLASNQVLQRYLSPDYLRLYHATKATEAEKFAQIVAKQEYEWYL